MSAPRSAGARLLEARLAAQHLAPAPSVTSAPLRALAAAGPAGPAAVPAADQAAEVPPMPDYVMHLLARWRLLHDVGFRYLVPDSRLMPEESIRFFVLDPQWLDALASGALASGGQGSRERSQLAPAIPAALADAAQHLPLVRDVARGRLVLDTPAFHESATGAAADAGEPAVVTGFLLHSAAVSGWPGMQVRAWSSADPADVPLGVDPAELASARPDLVVPLLRMEQLAPSVLLVLFSGEPRLIWLEEPHHGVQLGFEEAGAGWSVPIRSGTGQETGTSVVVPMRPGPVAGVVDVAGLRAALDAANHLPAARGSAAIALALLQAPSRQRFAASAPTPAPVPVPGQAPGPLRAAPAVRRREGQR